MAFDSEEMSDRKATFLERMMLEQNKNLECLSELTKKLSNLVDKLNLHPQDKEVSAPKELKSNGDIVSKMTDQSSRFSALNSRAAKLVNELEELI